MGYIFVMDYVIADCYGGGFFVRFVMGGVCGGDMQRNFVAGCVVHEDIQILVYSTHS